MVGNPKPTVVVVGGGWSGNIGNAFINLGELHVLRQALPEHGIVLFSDRLAHLDTLHKKTPQNAFEVLDFVSPQFIVLSGCCMSRRLPSLWGETFARLAKRGTQIVYLAAGLTDYTKREVEICRSFLRQFPPFLFVSRDSITYESFKDVVPCTYDGIEVAFWLPEFTHPLSLEVPPYIVFSFDRHPEPSFEVRLRSVAGLTDPIADGPARSFEFHDHLWVFEPPRLRSMLARKLNRFYPYVETMLLPSRQLPVKLGDYRVIRLDHQVNPSILRKIFRAPNTFSWDIPEPYLALYAQAQAVFTDRIHGCIVAMAYGRPAMLISETPRVALLDRVGAGEARNRPLAVSRERLVEEKARMSAFLKSVFSSA